MNAFAFPIVLSLIAAAPADITGEEAPDLHCGESKSSTVLPGGEISLDILGQPDAACADTLTEARALAWLLAMEFWEGVETPADHSCDDSNCDNPTDTCDALGRSLITLNPPDVTWDQALQQWCVQYTGGTLWGWEDRCTDCGVYYY